MPKSYRPVRFFTLTAALAGCIIRTYEMTIERQPAVSFTVPSRLSGVSAGRDGAVLSFDGFSVPIPGSHHVRALRRMQEAKVKRCGKFRLVFEFPAADIPSSAIGREMHRVSRG